MDWVRYQNSHALKPAWGAQQEQPPPPAAQQLVDWECAHCHNVNFRGRQRCNKCQRPAPQDSKTLQANKALLANAPVRPRCQRLTHRVRPAGSQSRTLQANKTLLANAPVRPLAKARYAGLALRAASLSLESLPRVSASLAASLMKTPTTTRTGLR